MTIDRLGPYPTMKDSGLPWLGDVPAHWRVRRIKTVFREKDERTNDGTAPLLSLTRAKGLLPQSEASNRLASADDLSNYKVCKPGDLVMNRMQAWSGMFAVSRLKGLVSPDYSVFQATEPCEIKHFEHLFRAPRVVDQFAQASKGIGSGFNRLYTPDFGAVPIVVPPLSEQHTIVRFLNHADRCIRRCIRAKQKLVALLEEQKRVIIHEAVTGRIDVGTGGPYPAYKDSAVEWSGTVPEHWKDVPLGVAAESIQTGPFGSQLHAGDYVSHGIPVINPSHLIHGKIRPDSSVTIRRRKAAELSRHELRVHDIVMARRGEVGRCALVTEMESAWVCGTGSIRIRPRSSIFAPDYLAQVLSAPMVKDVLNRASIGATMDNLNPGIVSRLRLPRPPLSQQVAILVYLSRATVAIGNARDAVRRQISGLERYRTRLISDVVTGKLDVREAAAELPDLDPLAAEQDPDDDFNRHPGSEASGKQRKVVRRPMLSL